MTVGDLLGAEFMDHDDDSGEDEVCFTFLVGLPHFSRSRRMVLQVTSLVQTKTETKTKTI